MSLFVLSVASMGPCTSWASLPFLKKKWIHRKLHVIFSSKPVLCCRSIWWRAAVSRIHFVTPIISEIVFSFDSIWGSIKLTSFFFASVTPYGPRRSWFLSCQGGAIRTIDSSDVNIFIHLTAGPVTKNVMTCQFCACVVRILQTICKKVTSCSQMCGVISKRLHLW